MSSDTKGSQSEPPTPLMLKVASKAPTSRVVKKALPKAEIEKLIQQLEGGEVLSKDDKMELRKEYSARKKWLKEKEVGNDRSHLFLLPNLVSGGGWLKVFDFSALYYVYRLADRMGRRANIMNDADRSSKMEFYAAIAGGIDNFREKVEALGVATYEGNINGIEVFRLKHPVSYDEYGQLRKMEFQAKERLHNALRPKNADPALYNSILAMLRQVVPKGVKVNKMLYYAVGDKMIQAATELVHVYLDYCAGCYPEKCTAGAKIVSLCDEIIATALVLVESKIWTAGVAATVGENVNKIKQLAITNFGLKG